LSKLAGFAYRPARPLGRPVEPASTPAPPVQNTPIKTGKKAGKHEADTLESRNSGSPDPKPYAADPQNVALKAGLKRLKLSGARFAILSGAASKTVEGWLQGIARPSGPAMTILDLIGHCAPARERLEAKGASPASQAHSSRR
jgi:DNA-binding transcriptional regulator YiaG